MNRFKGFEYPKENWSKYPHELINHYPELAEKPSSLFVLNYILRHTWGYQEFEKLRRISIDEFEHGRKGKDGSRLDRGVGFSAPTIISTLKWLEERGFILVEIDRHDAARIKKYYRLRMASNNERGLNDLTPRGKETLTKSKKTLPRSKKETSCKIKKKGAAPLKSRTENDSDDFDETFGPPHELDRSIGFQGEGLECLAEIGSARDISRPLQAGGDDEQASDAARFFAERHGDVPPKGKRLRRWMQALDECRRAKGASWEVAMQALFALANPGNERHWHFKQAASPMSRDFQEQFELAMGQVMVGESTPSPDDALRAWAQGIVGIVPTKDEMVLLRDESSQLEGLRRMRERSARCRNMA